MAREETAFISVREFNPIRAVEELRQLLGAKFLGATFQGFNRVNRSRFHVVPTTENKPLVISSGEVIKSARPGEIKVVTEGELTGPETSQIDALFRSHVRTEKSRQELMLEERESDLDFVADNMPLKPETDRDQMLTALARLILKDMGGRERNGL